MSKQVVYIELVDSLAKKPTRSHPTDAGLDLYSIEDVTIPARGKALLDTGVKIDMGTGVYGRVASRSGMSVRNSIEVGAGVIDESYRNTIGVILYNHGDDEYHVEIGNRIAQLIITKIEYPDVVVVKELNDNAMLRSRNGFGSTGK